MEQRCLDAFGLYQRCVSQGVVDYLQKQAGMKMRRSIYTSAVVIWLMILQRLQAGGTLNTAVEALLGGAADGLLSDCERERQQRMSRSNGVYSHAHQRLADIVCMDVTV